MKVSKPYAVEFRDGRLVLVEGPQPKKVKR